MEQQLVYFVLMTLAASLFPLLAVSTVVQDKAPDFEAESTRGTLRLADYLGKKNVLLAFYFKNWV
jgi:peroxiredoxin Q/BCP